MVIERLLLPPPEAFSSANCITGSLLDPAKELGRLEEVLLLKRLEHRRAKDRIEGARSFRVLLRFNPVVAVAGDGVDVVESRGWMVTITGTVDCSSEGAV